MSRRQYNHRAGLVTREAGHLMPEVRSQLQYQQPQNAQPWAIPKLGYAPAGFESMIRAADALKAADWVPGEEKKRERQHITYGSL